MKNLLLVVDVQKDFCPGGTLAVADGDAIVSVINRYVDYFHYQGFGEIAYTRDWHPANHCSFKAQGGVWPPHCVQYTDGSAFHPKLSVFGTIFSKGLRPSREEYSAIVDENSTLVGFIKGNRVENVYVCGIAADYCVKAHVLDLLKFLPGVKITVLTDAIAAVNIKPGDGEEALKTMTEAGADLSNYGPITSAVLA